MSLSHSSGALQISVVMQGCCEISSLEALSQLIGYLLNRVCSVLAFGTVESIQRHRRYLTDVTDLLKIPYLF